MTATTLDAAGRQLVMESIRHALLVVAPEWTRSEDEDRPGGLHDLEQKLDALIEIARRTHTDRVEPYLAEILDDVCSHCHSQRASAYCPLRRSGDCVLYAFAGPIMWAIGGALRRLRDPKYLATHGDAHGCQAAPPRDEPHQREAHP